MITVPTPEDMAHAQIMRHVADVIESEFPARAGWRAAPSDIAADTRARAIVSRIRTMADLAERRTPILTRVFQYRVTGQMDGQLIHHAIELPTDPNLMTEGQRTKYRNLARERFAEQHPNAYIRAVKSVEYSREMGADA